MIVTIAKIVLALLQALGWANSLAERRAGAAQSQMEAKSQDETRVVAAANAAAAVGVQPDPADIYDRDRIDAIGVQPVAANTVRLEARHA